MFVFTHLSIGRRVLIMCVSVSLFMHRCVLLTFRVQQLGEAQVLLSQVEGILQVVVSIWFLQLVIVYQVWSEEKPIRSIIQSSACISSKWPTADFNFTVTKGKGTLCSLDSWDTRIPNDNEDDEEYYLCLWMRALNAIPSLQLVVKLWMLTLEYLNSRRRSGRSLSFSQ